MCRLLGITNFHYTRHRGLVDSFCGLASSGNVMAGDPPGHEDGWGLAFYQAGNLVVHKSGGNILDETELVTGPLERVGESPVMILHLRKSAWKDSTCTRHAHPFHHGNAVFAHNGTVYEYQKLLQEITVPGLGPDALDTEVFFYHFMSIPAPDLGQSFLRSAAIIEKRCRFSALNCIFSDGRNMFAYRDYAKEPDYYSLYRARSESSLVVSSEPLDQTLDWVPMEKKEFLQVSVEPTSEQK